MAQEQLHVEGGEVKITQAQDSLDKIGQTTIYIIAQLENLTNVKALTTDLKGGQKDWIESSKVKVNPQQFNLIRGQPLELAVTFKGVNEGPGIYSGNLLLTSPNLLTVKIPITLTIHANPLIALSLVGMGVIVSFVFKFLLMKVKDREQSKTILEIGICKHNEIMQLKNRLQPYLNTLLPAGSTILPYPASFSEMSENKLEEAIRDYNSGRFHESTRKARDSISALSTVSLDAAQPPLTKTNLTRLSPKRLWLITPPIREDYAAYAGVTLALLLSVLLVWQTYYPQLSAFGLFPIDYIALSFWIRKSGNSYY